MLSKKFLTSLLILTCFLTIAGVSAADNATGTSIDDSSALTDSNAGSIDTSSLENLMNSNSNSSSPSTGMNMSGMDMSSMMNMSGMNMSGMNISGMNVSDFMNMSGMNMSDMMNMSGMNMSGMNMSDFMNMTGMNMSDIMDMMNKTPTDNTTTPTDTTPTDDTTTPTDTTPTDDTQKEQANTQPAKQTTKTVNKQTPTKTSTSTQKVGHTYTIKKASDNTVVYQGNAVTLEAINKIFNQDIVNGHLVVYMDGQVIFNGTITDDLATVLFDIIEQYLGNHNIKIDFTDANNNTNTYQEDIIIE